MADRTRAGRIRFTASGSAPPPLLEIASVRSKTALARTAVGHLIAPTTLHPAVTFPPLAVRRFQLRALGLDLPFRSVAAALDHLGYVQNDPLNICGRMHDLILRNRVTGYREGDLVRHLHHDTAAPASHPATKAGLPSPLAPDRLGAEARTAFEHHLPDPRQLLVAFPLEAWPHLRAAMRARARRTSAWSGRLTPQERALAPDLLAEIAARGPLSSADFEDRRRAHRTVWGKSSLVKSTLQKLFFHGELLIAERDKHRRRYDLPDRVLPAQIVAQAEAPEADTARWLTLLKLRQHRLVTLRRQDLPLVEDQVQSITVENCPTLYCLNRDLPLLEQCAHDAHRVAREELRPDLAQGAGSMRTPTDSTAADRIRLLAPLDPLIYDRRLTARLWDFDYTWEAYTPAAKRVRGHYALPVLAGTELVGHVEPKADRAAGKLIVASRSIRRGYRTSAAVAELASWLGLKR